MWSLPRQALPLWLLSLAACDRPCEEITDEATCRKRDDCRAHLGRDICGDGQLHWGSCVDRDVGFADLYAWIPGYLVDGRCLQFYVDSGPEHVREECELECLDEYYYEYYGETYGGD